MSAGSSVAFKNVAQPEQIIEAMRRGDKSYVRGVYKFYERRPPNKILLGLLGAFLARPLAGDVADEVAV